jgi:hypothetical protein
MRINAVLLFGSYVVVFIALLLGMAWWDRRRRRTRKPFPENLKLLRMPGEYLWRRVIEQDENEMQWFLGIIPAVIAIPGYWVIERRLGAVRLANPKVLPQVMASRGKPPVPAADIDLIRRQLEEKCRNVKY